MKRYFSKEKEEEKGKERSRSGRYAQAIRERSVNSKKEKEISKETEVKPEYEERRETPDSFGDDELSLRDIMEISGLEEDEFKIELVRYLLHHLNEEKEAITEKIERLNSILP